MDDKDFKMAVVSNKTGFQPTENRPRVNQQRMLPTAVPTRILGQIISGNPDSTQLGSGNFVTDSGTTTLTVANATSLTISLSLNDNFNRVIFAIPDFTIYTDTTTPGTPTISSADQWPNSTYGMGNMPMSTWNDWGSGNNVGIVTKVVIRNNTGSDRKIKVIYRFRIITNPTSGGSGTNV